MGYYPRTRTWTGSCFRGRRGEGSRAKSFLLLRPGSHVLTELGRQVTGRLDFLSGRLIFSDQLHVSRISDSHHKGLDSLETQEGVSTVVMAVAEPVHM